MNAIKLLFGLTPVIGFLAVLILFDSFKLVNYKLILRTILFGGLIALICLFINEWFINELGIPYPLYTRYGAPLIEEGLKASLLIYFLRTSRIGFMVDAAIFGFAAGTGFAIIENIFRFQADDLNAFVWLIRGLGTAVMHGAATAIFAVISKYMIDRHINSNIINFLPGLVVTVVIHSFFNHLLTRPDIITTIQLIALPLLFWLVYTRSERALHNWLEMGIDSEFELLDFLMSGSITETKVGEYLTSLKKVFPGTTIVNMICYLRVYLELSISAKGMLLMQQHGYNVEINDETRDKLEEFKYLDKSIGKTGERALAVIYRTEPKDLWQIYLLHNRQG